MKNHYVTLKKYEEDFMSTIDEIIKADKPLIRFYDMYIIPKHYTLFVYDLTNSKIDKFIRLLIRNNQSYKDVILKNKDTIHASFSMYQSNVKHYVDQVDE